MLALPLALGLVVASTHIVTNDPARPTARDAAIVNGRFTYVGDDLAAARAAAGPDAVVLDGSGETVVPGFEDAHAHFGLSLTLGADDAVDLGDGPADVATLRQAIVDAAARPVAPDHHDWIFVLSRALPDGVRVAADLPRVSRPLFVVTERGGIVNAVARQRMKLRTSDVPQGRVQGRLLPAALDRAVKSLPHAVLEAGAQHFFAKLARLGITSVQLMDELPWLFDGMRQAGTLTARVRMIAFGLRFETMRYVPHWTSPDDDWLRLDAVKYFDDDWARLPRVELEQIYAEALADHHDVVMHVLSRGALRTLLDHLDALELAQPGGSRWFRFDHVDEATPQLAARIAHLGIRVCSNPAMLPEWHSADAFPMRTLLDAGVQLCIGSDFVGRHTPPRSLSALSALQLAVTHGGYGTKERISVTEALAAFTRGSAEAEGRSDKGVVKVGALGDLTGLSGDPTTVAPETIGSLEVRFTVVGGRIVYRRPKPPPPAATIGPEHPRAPPSTIGPAARHPPPDTIGPAPPAPHAVIEK